MDVESAVQRISASKAIDLTQYKKAELFALCVHYNLSYVKFAWRKADIARELCDYLMDDGIISAYPEGLEEPKEENGNVNVELSLRKLELDHEKSMKEMQLTAETRMKELQCQFELRLQQLEHSAPKEPKESKEFDPSRNVRLVPRFNEDDVDKYFAHFEKIATTCKWPVEQWSVLLQTALVGKAQEAYAALSLEDSSDYAMVKKVILKAYELVPEAYRLKFRNLKKTAAQTYAEFAREKQMKFDRWCASRDVDDHDKLRVMILLEEFKTCLPLSIKTHLEDHQITDLDEAARMADDYALTHKLSSSGAGGSTSDTPMVAPNAGQDVRSTMNEYAEKLFCRYCKKPGHYIGDCPALQRKEARAKEVSEKSNAMVVTAQPENAGNGVHETFQPFSLHGTVDGRPITVLRDTGASQSLILSSVLSDTKSSTGLFVSLAGVGGGRLRAPLYRVDLTCDLMTRSGCLVAALDELPIDGVHMLLGNDLAGSRVVPEPIMSATPACDLKTEVLNSELYLFPACAVTRSMSKFVWSDQPNDAKSSFAGKLLSDVVLTKSSLLAEQQQDAELKRVQHEALTKEESKLSAICYYHDADGLLMRKWRDPKMPAEEWSEVHQVVLPRVYRDEVLRLAHSAPMAGHLGVRKTLHRVTQHFYWPKIRKDVVDFCRSCPTCQVVGKPNSKIPAAPLIPIPAIGEPFSHVIIDVVGPLPRTKSGMEYLLTVMDISTRYPEAFPLRTVTAKSVLKALLKFFTTFGLPETVHSDRGSNFLSKIFQQTMKELKVKHCVASAYHPESQGALERYHQCLKNMMKTFCLEHGSSWDEGVPLLLFATREVVQESLGFSPFELVFGHSVRGPLALMKDAMLENNAAQTDVLTYVSNFRQRLMESRDHARKHLDASQDRMKSWFDRKARRREFVVGQKVLVLIPGQGSALQARFEGPYPIVKKVGDVDYVVKFPSRTRLCHVNVLKPFHEKKVMFVQVQDSSSEDHVWEDQMNWRLENSSTLADEGGIPAEVKSLIRKYSIFPDIPTRTSAAEHDVDVGDARPIKQNAYRVNPLKAHVMATEISYMLENRIIQPSRSPWSSPCLLVPKADKKYRFCTDYRRVNQVTKTDCFPLPRIDDCLDQVGHSQFVSKLDLLKGYWQVPLTARAREISAFVTPQGFWEYLVMPFGMKNAPATFQRMMNSVTAGLNFCHVYIDDVLICSSSWEEHLEHLDTLFERLEQVHLTVNLKKCEFGKATVTYLGHVVGSGHVRPVRAKISAIENFPRPTGRKELMRYIGMAGFYRKFCRNFAQVIAPLTDLLKKSSSFQWDERCEEAFQSVKTMLTDDPVLVNPDYTLPFSLMVDACDVGAGAVLQQLRDDVYHPIAYFSKKFDVHQKRYSTIEKEALALVMAVKHFEVYLSGTEGPVVVFSDHNPLVFISQMGNRCARVHRWSLYLQAFPLVVRHIRGPLNIIADGLSRIF